MHFAGDAIPVSAAAREQSMSGVFCNGEVFSTACVGGFFIVFLTSLYTSGFRGRWPAKTTTGSLETLENPPTGKLLREKNLKLATQGGQPRATDLGDV